MKEGILQAWTPALQIGGLKRAVEGRKTLGDSRSPSEPMAVLVSVRILVSSEGALKRTVGVCRIVVASLGTVPVFLGLFGIDGNRGHVVAPRTAL